MIFEEGRRRRQGFRKLPNNRDLNNCSPEDQTGANACVAHLPTDAMKEFPTPIRFPRCRGILSARGDDEWHPRGDEEAGHGHEDTSFSLRRYALARVELEG